MKNKIENISGGLLCDNENCNWSDPTIKAEEYKNYINASCPKCGDNILTQEDYDNVMQLFNIVNIVNSMTEEEINSVKNNPEFEKITKQLGLDMDDKIIMTINTHKELSIKSIRLSDEEE